MSGQRGRISQLDGAMLAKLVAGCNYINAEIARLRRRAITAVVIIAPIAILLAALSPLPAGPVFFASGGLLLVFVGVQEAQLKKTYKHIVVGRIVDALGGGLSYSPESSLTKEQFIELDLCSRFVDSFSSEDEVRGAKNAVAFSIREVYASRNEGSGKHRRRVTVFQGVLVQLDFNKYFSGRTSVVSNEDSQLLGGLFGEWETRGGKTLTHMENVDFENRFSVYTTDAQQARYILTPKLMELILRAQAALDGHLRLAFHDHSVSIAVPEKANRFEVSLFKPAEITPESAAGELVELVQLAEAMVDTLDLETRIWTRV